jgi:hypothetical protein
MTRRYIKFGLNERGYTLPAMAMDEHPLAINDVLRRSLEPDYALQEVTAQIARKYLPEREFARMFPRFTSHTTGAQDVAFKPHIRPGGRRARDEDPDDTYTAVLQEIRSWSSEDQARLVSALSDAAEDDVDPEDEDTAATRSAALDKRVRPAMDSLPGSSRSRSNFDRMFPETQNIRVFASGVDRLDR